MDNIATAVLFTVGLALIIKGGDFFVDASVWIAEISGIPKFIIGATVVSLATTLPELVVSSIAAYRCMPDMAVGNAVGSVTANLGLIMSIGIIFMPSEFKRTELIPKFVLMAASAAALALLCSDGIFTSRASGVLTVLFAAFVYENIHGASYNRTVDFKKEKKNKADIPKNALKFIFGAAGITLGANMLVENGKEIAQNVLHIPESVVAVTLVALGTSLPELITTLTAISKKQASLSFGNILGANIIDLSLILPVCSAISGGGLTVTEQCTAADLPFCLALTAVCTVPAAINGKFTRLQGIAGIAIYALYIYKLICMLNV